MKIEVINNKGEDTGRKIELSNGIYKIEPNEHAVYLEVKQYLANQRQGTHKTKGKADVTGFYEEDKKTKRNRHSSGWQYQVRFTERRRHHIWPSPERLRF